MENPKSSLVAMAIGPIIGSLLLISAVLPVTSWWADVYTPGQGCDPDPNCSIGTTVFNFLLPAALFNGLAGLIILLHPLLRHKRILTTKSLLLIVGFVSILLFLSQFFYAYDLLDKFLVWYLDIEKSTIREIDWE